MTLVITGAGGLVGRSVVRQALWDGYRVRAVEVANRRSRGSIRRLGRFARRLEVMRSLPKHSLLQIFWGSVTDYGVLEKAVAGCQGVIHLAAVIPPASESHPALAEAVNVGGTRTLLKVLEAIPRKQRPVLAYAGSIAIYGDRRGTGEIRVGDPVSPGNRDGYAIQKAAAEDLVRRSDVDWRVLRLTYVVSPEKLQRDPLMFEMPLDTDIEICHADDVARAFIRGVENPAGSRKIFNIAGGRDCRTSFAAYLTRMLAYFGMEGAVLRKNAFSTADFHCGFMDTREGQELLGYQRITLEEYYTMVGERTRRIRPLVRLFRGALLRTMWRKSPYLSPVRREGGGQKKGLVLPVAVKSP